MLAPSLAGANFRDVFHKHFSVFHMFYLDSLAPITHSDCLGDRSDITFPHQYSAEGAVLTTISYCEFRSLASERRARNFPHGMYL